jgi:protein-S-isoprenylcysteine O-methyltransferase Ste14
MNIWARWAQGLNKIVTGNKRRRAILTSIALVLFIGIITLFVLTSFWVDKWLSLPHLPDTWWRYSLSAIIFVVVCILILSTIIPFFRSRGTPVPTMPPPKLITTGLYGYVRNPMALGILLMLEGLGFYYGSLSLIIVFAPLPVLLYALFIKAVEEPELEMRFGQEYRDYKKRVPMFIPRLKRRG